MKSNIEKIKVQIIKLYTFFALFSARTKNGSSREIQTHEVINCASIDRSNTQKETKNIFF